MIAEHAKIVWSEPQASLDLWIADDDEIPRVARYMAGAIILVHRGALGQKSRLFYVLGDFRWEKKPFFTFGERIVCRSAREKTNFCVSGDTR